MTQHAVLLGGRFMQERHLVTDDQQTIEREELTYERTDRTVPDPRDEVVCVIFALPRPAPLPKRR